TDELRNQHYGCLSSDRRLCRPRPQGCEACGSAGHAGVKVRAGDQPSDRADVGPCRADVASQHRRRGNRVNRREFITLVGSAAAWPLAARAQQGERMRRIAILMSTADDAEGQARIVALREGLQQLGWTEGRNLRIDTRWAFGDAERMRTFVTEVVQANPEVILANSSPIVAAL